MPLVLNEFFKDIFDETYGKISYKFNVSTKSVYLIKNGEEIKIGECSIDGISNLVTFHKEEKVDGYLRIPQPSWTIHKHLIDCGVIDFVEYRAGNTIYTIKRKEISFNSIEVKEFQGEPKYIIPLNRWDKKVIEIKPSRTALQETLAKRVDESWIPFFEQEFNKEYFKSMMVRIKQGRNSGVPVLPSQDNVFYAYKVTPIDKIKVVILGQDPYPSKHHAHGLAFSSLNPKTPPSLLNIYNEIQREYPDFQKRDNDLTDWALQGVFLLNTILTVTENQPNSHAGIGWETFTSQTINLISRYNKPIVWMLWGKNAANLYASIAYKNKKHLVLTAGHPSPNSVHLFRNCGHFKKCNLYLEENQIPQIKW